MADKKSSDANAQKAGGKRKQSVIFSAAAPEEEDIPVVKSESSFQDLADAEMEDLMAMISTEGDGLISFGQIGELVRAMGYHPTDAEIARFTKGMNQDVRITPEMAHPVAEKCREECKDVEPEHFVNGLLNLTHADSHHIYESELSRIISSMGEKIPEQDFALIVESYKKDNPGDAGIDIPTFVKYVVERATKFKDWD